MSQSYSHCVAKIVINLADNDYFKVPPLWGTTKALSAVYGRAS